MQTVWALGRWAVRRHWRSSLALVLLIGVGAGAATGAAMGARRTSTAFPRLVEELRPSEVVLAPPFDEPLDAADEAAVANLPHVSDLHRVWGFGMMARTAEGMPDFDGSGWQATGGPDGDFPYRTDRPKVLAGMLPPETDPSAVAINQVAAEIDDLAVGDTIRAMTFDVSEVSRLEEPATEAEQIALVRRVFRPVDLRVTGIYGEVEAIGGRSESADDPALIVSRAFVAAYPKDPSYRVLALDLADDTSREEAMAAIRRTIGARKLDVLTSSQEVSAAVSRSVAPVAGALWIFAILMGVATLLVAGQGLARSTRGEIAETASLGAIGMTRPARAVAALPRVACIALGSAAVAVLVAGVSSTWFPLAPVDDAEPNPGLRLDWPVLTVAAATIVVLVVLWGWVAAWRATAPSARPALDRSDAFAAVASSGLPVPVVAGLRLALRRGSDSIVPVGLVALATTIAVATVVGAIGFGTSLERLVETPRLYGWAWDAMVFDPPEAGGEVAARIAVDPDVRAVTAVRGQTVTVDGQAVLAAGFEPLRGNLVPTVTDGRSPVGGDEAALGARTMRRLGVAIGDTVEITGANGRPRTFRVVGRVLFPVTSPDVSSGADLGVGIALDRPGFDVVAGAIRPMTYYVDIAPSGRGFAGLRASYGSLVFGPQQPPDVRNYERVRPVPVVLAGLVAALGCGMLAFGLTEAIRRRRRDLAVLRTIGFDGRQVRWTLASQAMAVVTPAIVIGVPLGIVLGRQAWTVLANRLSIPAVPATSVGLVVLVMAVALLLANGTAAVAGFGVGRSHPADALRAE